MRKPPDATKCLGARVPWDVKNDNNLWCTSGIVPSPLQRVRDLDEVRVPEIELVGLSCGVIHLSFSRTLFLQVIVAKGNAFLNFIFDGIY